MPAKKGSRIIRGNDRARFDSKTLVVGECVEWQGGLSHNGYGKFMVGAAGKQKTWPAHRWSYLQAHGSVPDLLRHKCDNPKCVRVDHLEPGTQLENVHDALSRGRRKQTLTPDLVRHFREVRASGGSVRAAALAVNVNYWSAIQAASGKSWSHIQ